MIKAVLFDLDGTLADSLIDLADGVNRAIASKGFPTHEVEAFKYFAGDGIPKMIERALPENNRDADTINEIKDIFLPYYAIHYADNTYAYEGMPELVNTLKNQGFIVAVVTNKEQHMANEVVKSLYGDVFDLIFGKRDGIPAKPDPTAALMAMEELGVETGITTRSTNESFVSDCTIETDQLALIPDSYIDMTAEKIRIYKELDSISSEKGLSDMKSRLTDRFGTMPVELERLFDIVRIRQLGKSLGFEKIIVKNGVLIAFFISNPLSQYYRSNKFSKVLENVSAHPNVFEVKQPDGRLRIVVRNVDSLEKAYKILKML